MTDVLFVYGTASGLPEAGRIARALVERRLAACVNSFPVSSVYRWKGRVERAREAALIMKTTRRAFPRLAKAWRELHSYEVPALVALPIERGHGPYLAWVRDGVMGPRRR